MLIPDRPGRVTDGARVAVAARLGTRGAVTVAAALVVVLTVAAGLVVNQGARGSGATGETTYVTLEMEHMRYSESEIRVPAGNRLVIELRNVDEDMVHDLVLETGERSGSLAPGESTTMDVGVVDGDIVGWCSLSGHRQMGMALEIVVGEDEESSPDRSSHAEPGDGQGDATATGDDAADDLDLMGRPGPDFAPYDATLPPLEPLAKGEVRKLTLGISEEEREVAPGVRQKVWTFGDSAPGPVLHGEVGDTFEITMVNNGSEAHGIDFHAGSLAPDEVMRPIPPGESLVYRFTATRAGIWMYHCSSMPMSVHIANGMFGAVVIEPPGLPDVDRSYVLVQSEQYFGPQRGSADAEKVAAEQPDAVVFNGYANQYDHHPLTAKVGERVRTWVLDAGPSRPTAFHVVGTQFDRVYLEGSYLLGGGSGGNGGSQALALGASQGGFVEMTFPEPGSYPLVSHVMVDAERGAHGTFAVSR